MAALRDEARRSPHNLKGSAASESRIEQYIKRQNKRIQDQRAIADLEGITSALDVVKNLSQRSPNKNQMEVDIRHLNVDDTIVTIAGEARAAKDVTSLRQVLTAMAEDQTVTSGPQAAYPVTPGKVPFSFRIRVKRKPG